MRRHCGRCSRTLSSDTLELGYVPVDPAHRGRGLSLQITRLLLSQHTDRLFATTYDDRMKHTLETAGFVKRGVNGKAEGTHCRTGREVLRHRRKGE